METEAGPVFKATLQYLLDIKQLDERRGECPLIDQNPASFLKFQARARGRRQAFKHSRASERQLSLETTDRGDVGPDA